MSKSVIYAANTVAQAVTDGGVVNFGTVTRRYGCNCKLSGGNVVIQGTGYYDVDVNLTFTASGAGPALIRVLFDGVEIPGARATLSTASPVIYSVTIPATIREVACGESTITVVISGEAVTVNSAAIRVNKD